MAEYKALQSFGGVVSMYAGEVKPIDDHIAKDLISAGYIEKVSPAETPVKAENKKGGKK